MLLSSLGGQVGFLSTMVRRLKLRGVDAVRKETRSFTGGGRCERRFSLYISETITGLSALDRCYLPFMTMGNDFISCGDKSSRRRVRRTGRTVSLLNKGMGGISGFRLPKASVNHTLIRVGGAGRAPKGCPEGTKLPTGRPLGWTGVKKPIC